MRLPALFVLAALSSPCMAQVYRFGEPAGVAQYSQRKHKPETDRYTGVKPVVIIEKDAMTVVWGDSKSAGGEEKVWKAVIVNRTENTVSAVGMDIQTFGSAVMLYTIDTKRGFLYMSSHKETTLLNGSSAQSFVAELETNTPTNAKPNQPSGK